MLPQRTAWVSWCLLLACAAKAPLPEPHGAAKPAPPISSARTTEPPDEGRPMRRSEPPDAPRVVTQVRALYARTNDAIAAKRLTLKLFITASHADPADWQRTTEQALRAREQTTEESEPLDVARVHLDDGRIRKVTLTMTSQSGDWVKTVDYYFYPSGGLAFLFDEHFTYYGGDDELSPPFTREVRRYFAEDGREVRALSRTFQTETGKEVPETMMMYGEPPVFRKTSELPFR